MPPDPCPTEPGFLACPTPLITAHPGLSYAELDNIAVAAGQVLAVCLLLAVLITAVGMAIGVWTATRR